MGLMPNAATLSILSSTYGLVNSLPFDTFVHIYIFLLPELYFSLNHTIAHVPTM
jgi:hypothetical protein